MNLSRIASKATRALGARSALRSLAASSDPAARSIAEAVRLSRSAGAREATAAVERARAAMTASDQPVVLETAILWNEDSQAETETKTVAQVCRASVTPAVGRLLYALVRTFQPSSGVEMGSCLGLSAAYQASALAELGRGRLVTMEGQPSFARRADRTLASLKLGRAEVVPGWFQDTLGGVLDRVAPVDWAYVDGHHDEQATQDYFARLLCSLAGEAVLVFDDINWSDGMRRAWRAIAHHPRVAVVADLYVVGIVVVRAEHTTGPGVWADLMVW